MYYPSDELHPGIASKRESNLDIAQSTKNTGGAIYQNKLAQINNSTTTGGQAHAIKSPTSRLVNPASPLERPQPIKSKRFRAAAQWD